MRAVRTLSVTAAALAALFASATLLTGCMCVVSTYIEGPTTMRPGQTVEYKVMERGGDGAQEPVQPAGGTWAWNAQGPASSQFANRGGGAARWTAPSTPGKYTIYAVGRGAQDTTKAEQGKARREAQLVVTVDANANTPQEQFSKRPAKSADTPPSGPAVKILDTGNPLGIRKGGSAPSFTIAKPAWVVDFMDYHYIDGGGPAPGTLSLKGSDGKTYGPWQAKGLDGQGGVKNAFWDVQPKVLLPAGTYTIVDANPGTWSTNDKAKGVGFTTITIVYAQ